MMPAELKYTPADEILQIHAELDASFRAGKMRPVAYRKYALAQLGYMLKDNTERIVEAMNIDLGKPAQETHFTELGPSIAEVADAYRNLDKWARPSRPPLHLIFTPLRRVVYKEGKGVCLIIAPFNFPILNAFSPVVSALAAGNTVVLKPSEQTPATATLLAELVPKYLEPSVLRIVNGSVAETSKLLDLKWGHIMFTGSGRVGRIVAGAGAKTLTPVTLELGGKSPVFIDPETCNVDTAARRILFGKTSNSGQVCVAPDYIIVPRSYQDRFVEALKKAYDEFYPDGVHVPGVSMGRMVSSSAFQRVKGLLDATRGTYVAGGSRDESKLFITPTIVRDCAWDDPLMSEEIFGPVLPIVPVDTLEEGIEHVNQGDRPLTIYGFTTDSALQRKLREEMSSGSIIFNDIMIQVGVEGLPFGGIGESGSGYHNGKYGFDAFTHFRASLDSRPWLDILMRFRFPPYSATKIWVSSFLFASLPRRPSGPPDLSARSHWRRWLLFILATLLSSVAIARKKLGPS
ncbi:NAD-aldehyde dehydrogenase [Cylindrobasidium torrendii FP15055 ss-10]|uniref:Aldehyde dehydrogenase n=1 Tax=Cylindrobasidium torrendii FP15055 ss-10 TaxID=1314674 RepID=A0A0D7BDQ9_9AGAR|nr:NAD-aldehyde dehydrogenase [Cylindrobasidium torrendii FP15055 ss-10]